VVGGKYIMLIGWAAKSVAAGGSAIGFTRRCEGRELRRGAMGDWCCLAECINRICKKPRRL